MIHLLPPSLSREAHMVVLCARTTIDAIAAARIRQLAQGTIDWNCIAETAKWHGVVPMVYRNLLRHCAGSIVPTLLEDLKRYCQASALLSHSLARDLVALHRAFQRHGVEVVPFKGLSLAAKAYGDLTARECGDIDLIVRRADLPRARRVLRMEGYEPAVDAAAFECDPREAFNLYVKRSRAVTVDLQWIMADGTFSFRLDQTRFWKRLQPIWLAESEMMVLSPEDLLLVLCVHGAKHVFEQLKWVCDVAELLRRYPTLDWAYIKTAAMELRCWRILLAGLALTRLLFSISIPQEIRQAIIDDPHIPALARRMPRNLLSSPGHGLAEEDREFFFFATKDSWWERWCHGLSLCRDRSTCLSNDYPWVPEWRRLQTVYAATHPLRHVLRHVVPSDALRRRVGQWLLPSQ